MVVDNCRKIGYDSSDINGLVRGQENVFAGPGGLPGKNC